MDFRVKTFGAEAAKRLAFLVDEFGFAGPVHEHGDSSEGVRYTNGRTSVRTQLVLWYMGEEYVSTDVIVETPEAAVTRTTIGHHTAHKGHEMRRALDQQRDALRAFLHSSG